MSNHSSSPSSKQKPNFFETISRKLGNKPKSTSSDENSNENSRSISNSNVDENSHDNSNENVHIDDQLDSSIDLDSPRSRVAPRDTSSHNEMSPTQPQLTSPSPPPPPPHPHQHLNQGQDRHLSLPTAMSPDQANLSTTSIPKLNIPRTQTMPSLPNERRPTLHRSASSFRSLGATSVYEADEEEEDETTEISPDFINILLREAVQDTPSFRASVLTTHEKVIKFEQWLSELENSTAMVVKRLEALCDLVSGYCSAELPSFVQNSLLDNDCISLLVGRYGETCTNHWNSMLESSRENHRKIEQMVNNLKENVFSKYYSAKIAYDKIAADYHIALYAYVRLPPQSEPAAFRDSVLGLRKLKWNFACAATALVVQIQRLQAESTVELLETLSSQSTLSPQLDGSIELGNILGQLKSKDALSENKNWVITSATEFYRLRSLGEQLRKNLPATISQLRALRQSLLREVRPGPVSVDLKDYEADVPPQLGEPIYDKAGWVFVVHSDNNFYPLYAYICNGVFGLLSISNNAVAESNKYLVSNCEVSKLESTSRKNLLKIKTESDTIVLQAVGSLEYAMWLSAFENGAAEIAPIPLRPWNVKYTVSFINGVDDFDLAPGYEVVSQRAAAVARDMSEPHWMNYDGTLRYNLENKLIFTTPVVKPVPTEGMTDSIVGNWFFSPKGIPTSITANFWGTDVWIQKQGITEVRYRNHFPRYPKKYPRNMMIQDMDMRAITDRLPIERRPRDDEFLIFMVRGTCVVDVHESPMRMFVTSRNVFVYMFWAGFLDIKSLKLNRIVDVESEYSAEKSELRLIVQNDVKTADVMTFNLYIDSSELAKTRLDFLVTNSRNRTPIVANEIFELMTLKSLSEVDSYRNPDKKIENLADWLFSFTIDGASDKTGANTTKLGQGVHTKLAEDTFPISARALFHVIFGPRSPVFNSTHETAIDCDYHAGAWYKRGRKLERKVYLKYGNELKVLDSNDNDNDNGHGNHRKHSLTHVIVQQVVTQNKDLVVVIERRPSWETFTGDKFYLELKYFIYSTGTGSFMQIWSRTVWIGNSQHQALDQTVDAISKMMVKPMALSIREAADAVSSYVEARDKYGDIYATKVVAVSAEEENYHELSIAKLNTRTYFRIMARVPLRFLKNFLKWSFWFILAALQELSLRRIAVVSTLVLSLVLNVVFFRQSSVSYWNAKLEKDHTHDLMTNLGLTPNVHTVLKRAIYDKDIEDSLLTGGFWNQSDQNLCTNKFSHLVSIASNIENFKPVYDYEESIVATTEQIENLRLAYAIKRNELMTDIWMLNAEERERIQEIYRKWLIDETIMCSRVRPYLSILNATVFDNIHDYCISCLEEAKMLI